MTGEYRAPLDPREQTFLIDGGREGLLILLRRLPYAGSANRGPVLYLHGATFPSVLSIAYRFSDGSWRDALCNAGFDVWALDFLDFGGSDRYPEMEAEAQAHGPLGLAMEAGDQVEAAARFLLDHDQRQRLAPITQSWGSMPAGLFAARCPTLVDRIVMFAPLARRDGPRYTPRPNLPAWKLVNNEEQWTCFVEDVPLRTARALARRFRGLGGGLSRSRPRRTDSNAGCR